MSKLERETKQTISVDKERDMRYEEIIEEVRNGSKFMVDFKERSVKLNGKKVDTTDLGIPQLNIDESLRLIENHYYNYKRSVPSERNDSKRRRYFKADKVDNLSDKELCCNEEREAAQVDLELLVLGLILNGSLAWNDERMGGTWFWVSRRYPTLVILKEWL